MNRWSAPKGFRLEHLPTGPAWIRPDTRNSILGFWRRMGSSVNLSRAATRDPAARIFSGRGQVVCVPAAPGKTIVIRPCLHGGWWGRLAGDRYFGAERVRREIEASRRLESLQIPTPHILAALFYPAGPWFRMEVVTAHVPESRDLLDCLARRPGPSERAALFSAVRKLFGTLHRLGIHHPDFNARNLLLAKSGRRGWKAWILDVDTLRWGKPGDPRIRQANRNRLLRSLLKQARLGKLGQPEHAVGSLWKELFPRS